MHGGLDATFEAVARGFRPIPFELWLQKGNVIIDEKYLPIGRDKIHLVLCKCVMMSGIPYGGLLSNLVHILWGIQAFKDGVKTMMCSEAVARVLNGVLKFRIDLDFVRPKVIHDYLYKKGEL
jgi:hypothetical protein